MRWRGGEALRWGGKEGRCSDEVERRGAAQMRWRGGEVLR